MEEEEEKHEDEVKYCNAKDWWTGWNLRSQGRRQKREHGHINVDRQHRRGQSGVDGLFLWVPYDRRSGKESNCSFGGFLVWPVTVRSISVGIESLIIHASKVNRKVLGSMEVAVNLKCRLKISLGVWGEGARALGINYVWNQSVFFSSNVHTAKDPWTFIESGRKEPSIYKYVHRVSCKYSPLKTVHGGYRELPRWSI